MIAALELRECIHGVPFTTSCGHCSVRVGRDLRILCTTAGNTTFTVSTDVSSTADTFDALQKKVLRTTHRDRAKVARDIRKPWQRRPR